MTTVALIRSTYLDTFLERIPAATEPWTDAELQAHITNVLTKLWPRNGIFVFGDVASSATSQLYTIPAALTAKNRISRIDVLESGGLYVDRVSNWRPHSPTQVLIKPLVSTGYTFRFYGWKPFAVTAADLDTDLEETIAHRAASRAYGQLAASLVNSQRQQNLDSGRVVSYQDAIGLAAYYERLFADGIADHPSKVNQAPRAAHRG